MTSTMHRTLPLWLTIAAVGITPPAAAQQPPVCTAAGQQLGGCVTHIGACIVTGRITCQADGSTECVAASPVAVDGPDFADNDCDGWVDEGTPARLAHGLTIMDQCEAWLGWANRNEVAGAPEADFTRDGARCGPGAAEGVINNNLACVRSAGVDGWLNGLRTFPIRTSECRADTFGENDTFGVALRCPRTDAPQNGPFARFMGDHCWLEMALVSGLGELTDYLDDRNPGDDAAGDLGTRLGQVASDCRTGRSRAQLANGSGCVWTRNVANEPDTAFHPLPLGDGAHSFDGDEALAIRLVCDDGEEHPVETAARGDFDAWYPTTMPPVPELIAPRLFFSAPDFGFDGDTDLRYDRTCVGCAADTAAGWSNGRACAAGGTSYLPGGWGAIDFRKLLDCAEDRPFGAYGNRDNVGVCGGAGDDQQRQCTSDDRNRWTNRCGMLDRRSRFGIGLMPIGGCDRQAPEVAACL